MPSSLRTRKVSIHPFEFARGGFVAGCPLLSVLVRISAAALRIPSKFHLGGLFLRSPGLLVLGLAADCHKYSIFLLCWLLRLTSVVAIWLRNWIFLGEALLRKDGFD